MDKYRLISEVYKLLDTAETDAFKYASEVVDSLPIKTALLALAEAKRNVERVRGVAVLPSFHTADKVEAGPRPQPTLLPKAQTEPEGKARGGDDGDDGDDGEPSRMENAERKLNGSMKVIDAVFDGDAFDSNEELASFLSNLGVGSFRARDGKPRMRRNLVYTLAEMADASRRQTLKNLANVIPDSDTSRWMRLIGGE